MKTFRAFLFRVAGLFGRNRRDREFSEELESNLQFHIEDNMARGMSPEEARRQALIRLGGLEPTKEAYRDQRGLPWLETLAQDLRYGIRVLAKSPGFSIVAVLSLALGIGANIAIFSIVNSVLFRPLPFVQPGELVSVWEVGNEGLPANATFATWTDWRRDSKSFAEIALIATWEPTANGEGGAEQLAGARVTHNFFRTLGVRPLLGRDFTPEEDVPGNNKIVMLTYGLWKRRYGGDPDISGKTITINQTTYIVAGVLPRDFRSMIFRGNSEYEIYRVLGYSLSQAWTCRTCHHLMAVGRLHDGVVLAQAQAEMNGIQRGLKERYPKEYSTGEVLLQPLKEQIVAPAAPALRLLWGAVGLVLLIACANVANLLLARSTARRQEIALRVALGAGRARIVRQLLTENCLLAAIAASIGLIPAYWTPSIVRYFGGGRLPRLEEVQFNSSVVLFAIGIAIATGLVSGLLPAIRITSSQLSHSLSEGARGSGRKARANSALVAVEVCLSVMLLIGAGLLLRSMVRVLSVDPGFDPANALTLRLTLSGPKYEKKEPFRQFYSDVVERVSALPGVIAAGAATQIPLAGNMDRYGFHAEGKMNANPELDPSAERYAVTPGYLQAMRIPLLSGRSIERTDVAGVQRVVVINRAAARTIWPGEDPIGKQVKLGGTDGFWWVVVGVVGDVHHSALDAQPTLQVYIPFEQWPWVDDMNIIVRTASDPAAQAPAVRAAIRGIDPNQPISQLATFEDWIAASLGARRFTLFLIAGFAALALLLAAVGVYGVTSYSVEQRTREIGIRVALGATPSRMLRMVLADGLAMTAAGAVLGVVASLALTRTMSSMLFGVGPGDPVTLLCVPAILLVIAAAACWIPARRATRVDPQIVLRQE